VIIRNVCFLGLSNMIEVVRSKLLESSFKCVVLIGWEIEDEIDETIVTLNSDVNLRDIKSHSVEDRQDHQHIVIGVEKLSGKQTGGDAAKQASKDASVGKAKAHPKGCFTGPLPETFQMLRVSGALSVLVRRDVTIIKVKIFTPVRKDDVAYDRKKGTEIETGPVDHHICLKIHSWDACFDIESEAAAKDGFIAPEEWGYVHIVEIESKQGPKELSRRENMEFGDTKN